MRPSTRNQLPGTVTSILQGEAMAVVKVTLEGGQLITSSTPAQPSTTLALLRAPQSRFWSSPLR